MAITSGRDWGLQGNHVRIAKPGNLFAECIMVCRQKSAVESLRQLANPRGVEAVKDASVDASPIMNGHSLTPLTLIRRGILPIFSIEIHQQRCEDARVVVIR